MYIYYTIYICIHKDLFSMFRAARFSEICVCVCANIHV